MSELPNGWELVPLRTLIELNPKTIAVEDCTEVGFVPMALLGKRWFDVPGFELRQWASVKKGYTHFQDGDVLLAKITPCFENGKAGLIRGLPNGIGSGSTEYFVCRTSAGTLDSRYLLAYLKTDDFMHTGAMSMTGSVGHKRVPKEYLLGREIPLAPQREQTRIANQLDTLLARIEACNDRFNAILALLKRFRQTVFDAGLSGALLDIDSETAIESEVPKVSISTIAAVGTGSTPLRSNSQFFASTGTPWVTSSATSNAVITTAHEFVTSAAVSAHRLKLYPKGTLLVAMYGEGKTRGQVAELGIDATINQACAAIVVDKTKALTAYVKLALQANYLSMRELAEGGNQPNLNLSKVKEFEIPLPSLAVQTKIVHRVQAFFALADRIEARCTAARAQAQRLTPLVLAKAFRGELVPQDSNDEPASALLARIASSDIAVAGKISGKCL